MAELIITGVVQVVFDRVDTVGSTGNTFSKRDIVIRTEEQYPQDIAIQFTQDKCDLLDIYKVGESVTIAFNLRGKSGGWVNPQGETKYFNTIQGWKISRNGQQAPSGNAPATQQPAMPPSAAPAAALTSKKYIHTATDHTEAVYLNTPGWTHDVLVAQDKGRWETVAATPDAPAPVNDDLPF